MRWPEQFYLWNWNQTRDHSLHKRASYPYVTTTHAELIKVIYIWGISGLNMQHGKKCFIPLQNRFLANSAFSAINHQSLYQLQIDKISRPYLISSLLSWSFHHEWPNSLKAGVLQSIHSVPSWWNGHLISCLLILILSLRSLMAMDPT